nr:hypothetical protein CFP56_69093 [Quercus suber]
MSFISGAAYAFTENYVPCLPDLSPLHRAMCNLVYFKLHSLAQYEQADQYVAIYGLLEGVLVKVHAVYCYYPCSQTVTWTSAPVRSLIRFFAQVVVYCSPRSSARATCAVSLTYRMSS